MDDSWDSTDGETHSFDDGCLPPHVRPEPPSANWGLHPPGTRPLERIDAHKRSNEHTWTIGYAGHTECAVCGISQSDWELMRQARAQLEAEPPAPHDHVRIQGCYRCVLPDGEVPVDAMTTLERQLSKQVADLEQIWSQGFDNVEKAAYQRGLVDAEVYFLAERDQMRAVVVAARKWADSPNSDTAADYALHQALAALDAQASNGSGSATGPSTPCR